MQDLEKLVDVAVDLRVATLRAKEQGIIGMHLGNSEEEAFHIYSEEDFKQMIANRKYTIEKTEDSLYKYQYNTIVAGLNFFLITIDLLNADDESKVEI